MTGSPAAFEAHLASGDAGPVRLLELGFGTDIRLQRGPVDDYIGIVIPLSGWLRVRLAGTTFVAQPYRTMTIVGNDQPMDISWPPRRGSSWPGWTERR